MPTKIGLHAFHINPYLYEFFELILFDSIFSLPWTGIFENSNISETREAMPTKTGVHAFDINPYLLEFFELILLFKPINCSPMVQKKILREAIHQVMTRM